MKISKQYITASRTIQDWAEEDRPREKLIQRGRMALTDAELLAILIGSGTVSETAVDVAKNLLSAVNHDLRELGKQTPGELMKTRGIGKAKAIVLLAAMELGRRRKERDVAQRIRIVSSASAYEEMRPHLQDKQHEEFWILLLNRANEVIRPVQVSLGGVSGTVVDVRLVFKHAVENLASSVILAHNHPSGSLRPSASDKTITRQLSDAGRILSIQVLDHLIVSDNGYFSFADEGML